MAMARGGGGSHESAAVAGCCPPEVWAPASAAAASLVMFMVAESILVAASVPLCPSVEALRLVQKISALLLCRYIGDVLGAAVMAAALVGALAASTAVMLPAQMVGALAVTAAVPGALAAEASGVENSRDHCHLTFVLHLLLPCRMCGLVRLRMATSLPVVKYCRPLIQSRSAERSVPEAVSEDEAEIQLVALVLPPLGLVRTAWQQARARRERTCLAQLMDRLPLCLY